MIASALAFFVPYKLVVIGLVLLAAVVVIDRRATYKERAKCDVAAMRAERDAAIQDLNAEKASRKNEEAINWLLIKRKETDDEASKILDADLAKRPVADRCPLSAADAERLR